MQVDRVHVILSIVPKYNVSSIIGFLEVKLVFRVADMLSTSEEAHII